MQTSKPLGDVIEKIFALHFSTDDYTAVTCGDCIDFKTMQCPGRNYSGRQCLHCMASHLTESHGKVLQ